MIRSEKKSLIGFIRFISILIVGIGLIVIHHILRHFGVVQFTWETVLLRSVAFALLGLLIIFIPLPWKES